MHDRAALPSCGAAPETDGRDLDRHLRALDRVDRAAPAVGDHDRRDRHERPRVAAGLRRDLPAPAAVGRRRQRGRARACARARRDEGPRRRSARSCSWWRALEATGRTARVRSYFDDEDPGLLSPDRDAAAITIGMGRDAEDGIKDVIDVVEQADARADGSDDHGRVHRRRRLPHALEQGSEGGRALLRAAGGADRAPARLRRRRRGADPGPARDRRDHRRARARRDRRPGLGGLLLRRQHADGDGARARRRLRPLHRQPLP